MSVNINDVIRDELAKRMQDNVAKIKNLGMGYGDIMEIASALWRDANKQSGLPVEDVPIPVMPSHVNKAKLKKLKDQSSIYDSWINYKTEENEI